METIGSVQTGRPADIGSHVATTAALLPDRLRKLVRDRPWLAVAAVGAAGAALGGLVFPRAGRLAFLAVAGYLANEIIHHEGVARIDDVIGELASEPSGQRRSRA
jgi:hypothetical protein